MSARALKHPQFGQAIPPGRIGDVVTHENRDRCAVRDAGPGSFGVVVQCWTNREALARSIRMQQQRAATSRDWRPLVPLKVGEGY